MYLNFHSKLGELSKSSRTSNEAISGSAAASQNHDMQSIGSSAKFTESTDCTNVRSSSDCNRSDEKTDLRRQVAELSQTVVDLKSRISTEEFHLESIQCENERLTLELKKQQRCNRNLKQQLDDERFFYQKEKEHFCEEMQNHKARCANLPAKAHRQQRRESERFYERLENENKQLRDELVRKNEVTYNLCLKFLRMKDARDTLRQKLDHLLREHLQVMAEMMEKLDEAREELNIIVSEKFQEPLPISKGKFLQVVQRNSKFVYENSRLKLQIQQLMMNIERLKSSSQQTKTINVDARAIERLAECSRRRRDNEAIRVSPLSCSTSPSLRKTASAENSLLSENATDSKIIATTKIKRRGKQSSGVDSAQIQDCTADSRQIQDSKLSKGPTERTRSAPEVVQTSSFRQIQFSESATNCTNFTDKSCESCDVCMDTIKEESRR